MFEPEPVGPKTDKYSEAIHWPPNLREEWPTGYRDGATEPHTQQVVAALLTAMCASSVLELGTYKGHTSVWLCHALQCGGGGRYLGVELDGDRQAATIARLSELKLSKVDWQVVQADVFAVLATLPAHSLDFVWVDDDHTPRHVAQELEMLYDPTRPEIAKVKPGGMICMHDVCGGTVSMPNLGGVCCAAHGYVLTWPRIGALGGLGIIQVPTRYEY